MAPNGRKARASAFRNRYVKASGRPLCQEVAPMGGKSHLLRIDRMRICVFYDFGGVNVCFHCMCVFLTTHTISHKDISL
jgi:hypothetical protein